MMSFRLFTNRLFRHGRFLIQNFYKRDIHTTVLDNSNRSNRNVAESLKRAAELTQQTTRNHRLFQFGNNARRLFVDNILNRVTTPYSAELRNQATKKFLYGDSTPFFALVGVSLASGSGLLTKDDELEGVCYEIREAVARFQHNWTEKELNESLTEDLNLNSLDIGPPIAKGCNAVVYAAKLKEEKVEVTPVEPLQVPTERIELPQVMSPVQHISRFIHNFGGSSDNIFLSNYDYSNLEALNRDVSRIRSPRRQSDATASRRVNSPIPSPVGETENQQGQTVRFASRVRQYSTGSFGSNESFEQDEDDVFGDTNIITYPMALKIMFNYDIESNAMSILRAMHKETVPARQRHINEATEWEKKLMSETIALPPHPNVVAIYGVFCDRIPKLRSASKLYPMALPPRLNPHGYGRNMSLFLLMKRYEGNLRDYLQQMEIDTRDRVLLFAQLLEAIAHLNRHGVAHRDLKSDNILIEINEDEAPVLVLSDFGCCIADRQNGLTIPYSSSEMDKGGNTALMAPEIILKQPGPFSMLDYSKADLWSCGTIAYEIFGKINPFYQIGGESGATLLSNTTYEEKDLPELPEQVPFVIKKLVANILQRTPRKRLSTDVAANVVQLYLWAPSRWLNDRKLPSSNEILQWLLCLTTKTLCEGGFRGTPLAKSSRRTHTEYFLISSFLARARLNKIRSALDWIQGVLSDEPKLMAF